MKKVLLTVVLCVFSNVLFAQYSPVSKNIISTNLLQFFEQPAGFGIAYERMLDKGRSNNVAQFSMKLDVKKISDADRDAYQTFEDQLIYDEDAYQYSGYAVTPEVKYYFGWNAPFGPYFSLFGKYSNYQESFKDLADENNNYNWKINLESLKKNIENIKLFPNSQNSFKGNTLFIKGKNSNYIQEKHLPKISNFFPNYSLREIANSGHWPHTEQQDLFRKELLTFFM